MASDLAEYMEAFAGLNTEIDPEYWPEATSGMPPDKPRQLVLLLDESTSSAIVYNEMRLTSGALWAQHQAR